MRLGRDMSLSELGMALIGHQLPTWTYPASGRYFDKYDTVQKNSLFLLNTHNCLF